MNHRIIAGSERTEFHADKITACRANARIAVTVVLTPDSKFHHLVALSRLIERQQLTVHPYPSDCAILVRGDARAIQRTFNVALRMHHTPQGVFRCRSGPVSVPVGFGSHVLAVLGLDTRQQAAPHYHRPPLSESVDAHFGSGYLAPQVASIYGFPSNGGAGHSIGIIELGGGYQPAALRWYFQRAEVRRAPNVSSLGRQHPGDANSNMEVMLDTEIVASLVPKASTVIYFAPNTTAGFYNAVARAIRAGHDAISISWGAPESDWTVASLDAFSALAATTRTNDTTILAASGDSGSSDGEAGNNVDFPASCPYILGCGGTTLVASGGVYGSETVWNADGHATGGGVSQHFAVPDYQASVNPYGNTQRMVPDVAANADPHSGYLVRVNGQSVTLGGTSASAPLWAALICRLNAKLGRRLGFVNPALYGLPPGSLRDVTNGANGAYTAAVGFDCATGLGTPPSTLTGVLQ